MSRRPAPGLSRTLIATAAQLSAATIHEASGQLGALPARIKPLSPTFRLCGQAFTVRCAPGDNLWLHRAIYQASPGDILVMATGSRVEAGYWGEIMTRAALRRKLGGVVLDGGARDSTAIARLGLPVFASEWCLRGTTKNPRARGALNVLLRIGEVIIAPGDLVVGDADGVVVVSMEEAATTVREARTRAERETAMITALARGSRTLDLLGLS